MKMSTPQEKAQCVSWFIETKSVIQAQRNFTRKYGRKPPARSTIRAWHEKFMETGSVLQRKGAGRPQISEEEIESVRVAYTRSPRKSIRRASTQLQIPRSTIHKVLHRKLRLYAYKVQLLQALKPEDKPRRKEFAVTMLDRLDSDPGFLKRVCFSDESTFHVSGLINRHNSRIWGSQNPHETYELERDSPKLNVWCGIMHDKIIGPFFFAEKSITAQIYLDLLTEYVSPQLEQYQPQLIFQQDGAPPHWGLEVRQFLNDTFPERWIGRDGPIPWLPHSPDITPLDFFLWGYVKDIVYRTKVRDVSDLQQRIIEALDTVTVDMLARTWLEIEYRLDILRATDGAHVEVY